APYTTSSMQQDALNKAGLSLKRCGMAAQELYQGVNMGDDGMVALVTYIRTDSVRVAPEAQYAAKDFIINKFGPEFAPESFNFYKSKKQSQDAHEAIRPITLSVTPESVKDVLSKNHYRLYKLIYERFLASQMTDAKFNVVTVDINANDATFRASGRTVLFRGYTAVYDTEKEEKEDEESAILPDLNENDILNLNEIKPEQKFTKPPARYTDASLIKALEEKGIGRPSTYATIISVLLKRTYTVKEGKSIKPTDLAFSVNEILIKSFDRIVDISFTARMEDMLDGIEEGGTDWHNVISDFYPWLEKKLLNAGDSLTEESDKKCEKCGSMMLIKIGRYGKYYACSNYPECSNIVSFENETTDEKCDKCGSDMVVKVGKYGKFLACSNYPACSNIKSFGEEISDVPCEQCGQMMVYRNGRFGRYLHCAACKINRPAAKIVAKCPNCGQGVYKRKSKAGKIYYSCQDYKNCKFISWDMPYGKCPKCGNYTVVKFLKDHNLVKCSDKECDYTTPYVNESDENNSDEVK
ncbi:MAG: DNA topoisomerase, partial [Firmicutes bacterium]|nr:DNA topoisomerase [Bacillota bacterium]